MEIGFKRLQEEIPHKELSVSDLTKFIMNRVDSTPNYSLLLGAGCSVTSEIRPASTLIKEWKEKIYEEMNSDKKPDDSALCDFFKTNQKITSWYDTRNEYSCLFEKQYNLPKQRRAFVEKEVNNKNPSLGYAYLMNIIKKRFINTIFTTNFDDLINEAFYQFSDERPIVCAHDSAISSITITSDRPKIIKLHGDYLFDDIKSTTRETESLEENMKSKFTEFAKDSGLIVVGYSGNDRSIMDVISRLLTTHQQYFSHGIYWCLRDDSYIPGELRKLFWDPRVYYVNIDGFDELMAMLNDKLNNSLLPIDTYARSNKTIETISNLIEGKHIKSSKCPVVIRDLQTLEKQLRVNEQGVALDVLSDDKIFNQEQDDKIPSQQSHLTKENRIFIRAISALIYAKGFPEALEKIKFKLNKPNNSTEFKKELFTLKARIHLDQGDKTSALNCFREQAKLTPKNVYPFLNLATFTEFHKDKLSFLDSALHIDPYDHVVLENKARILKKEVDNASMQQFKEKEKNFFSTIQKGITSHPTIYNKYYQILFNYYLEKSKIDESSLLECKKIIEELKKQKPYHPTLAKLNIKLMLKQNEAKDGLRFKKEDQISNYLTEFESNVIEEHRPSFLVYKLNCYRTLRDKANVLKTIEEFESTYKPTAKYYIEKAEAQFIACRDLESAIATLEKALSKHNNTVLEAQYVDFLLKNDDYEKAKKAINKYPDIPLDLLEKYYCLIGDFDKAITLCKQRYQDFPESSAFLSSLSFLYLKNQKYKEVEELLKANLHSGTKTKTHLLVNYQLARFGLNKSVQDGKLKELRKEEKRTIDQAALCCLLDKKKLAMDILEDSFKADFKSYFIAKYWLVFDILKKEDRFNSLMANHH